MGFKLDPREIGWAPYAMMEAASASVCWCSRPRCSSSPAKGPQLPPAAQVMRGSFTGVIDTPAAGVASYVCAQHRRRLPRPRML